MFQFHQGGVYSELMEGYLSCSGDGTEVSAGHAGGVSCPGGCRLTALRDGDGDGDGDGHRMWLFVPKPPRVAELSRVQG